MASSTEWDKIEPSLDLVFVCTRGDVKERRHSVRSFARTNIDSNSESRERQRLDVQLSLVYEFSTVVGDVRFLVGGEFLSVWLIQVLSDDDSRALTSTKLCSLVTFDSSHWRFDVKLVGHDVWHFFALVPSKQSWLQNTRSPEPIEQKTRSGSLPN